MNKIKDFLVTLVFLGIAAYAFWRFPAQKMVYGTLSAAFLLFAIDNLFTRFIKFKLLLQLGLTFVFLDLSFKGVKWEYLQSFWYDINFIPWIPLVAINVLLALALRAFKWKYLFSEPVRFKDLSTATFIGFLTLAIFPARIGEVIRGFILSERTKMAKSHVLTTIFLERVFDGLGIFTLMLAVFLMAPLAKDKFLPFIILTCIGYVVLLALIVLFYFFSPTVEKLIVPLVRRFAPKLEQKSIGVIHKIHGGLHLFTDAKKMFAFLFFTILVWWLNMLTTYLLLRSVDFLTLFQITQIDPSITILYVSLLMLVLICFAIAIPSGPGGAGPYQYIVLFTVILLNPAVEHDTILRSKAAGLSIYLWLIQNLVVILFGSWVYFRNHYTWKELKGAKGN